jgi:hypothetical protein
VGQAARLPEQSIMNLFKNFCYSPLGQKADEVMAELGQIRERIAANEYRK